MTETTGHLGLGARLTEGPAPELVASAFALEAGDGPLLYTAMSLADLAHTLMLIEIGLIPGDIGAKLLTALLELHAIPGKEFPFDPANGDAYTNREYVLRQKAPEVAGWLQAGRPRREVSTLGYVMVIRERLLSLTAALLDLMQALLDLAKANLDTLMPDYTYLQTAHPTTLAHYLLTFVQPMIRDLARLQAVFERINLSPAGAGSTNGSRLPLNRERLAELLAFDGVVLHARDAMWSPDIPIEVMGTVVAMLVNSDRLAEDLQIWATAEFNFIELADRHSRISVIMPQKKNPYSLAFVRGVTREMIGRQASVAAVGATPSGQVDNRIFIYGGVPHALEQARQAVQLLAGVVAGLSINRQVMTRRAAEGFSGATDLVDLITLRHQLDTQTAHRIVGQAVRTALETNSSLTSESIEAVAHQVLGAPLGITNETVLAALTPATIIETRTGMGGAAPKAVQAMISNYQAITTETKAWQAAISHRLAEATMNLLDQAQKLAHHEPN